MAERFYWFLLGALCVWRVTHGLTSEDGPWNSFAKLRRAVDGGFWADLLDCFYCLSIWVSAPFAVWIGASLKERFLLWLAISASAILIERVTARRNDVLPAQYFEHQGADRDVLLREK